MGGRKQHVVLFPFMAQGHLIPFLSLAEVIHHKNPDYAITLVNTPLNIRNLKSSLPPNSNINLRALPFQCTDHGLPPDSENTDAIPFHLMLNLFQASETLQPTFEQLIAEITQEDSRPPLCIIADNFLGWTVHVARKFGVFHTVFLTGGAYGTAVFHSLWRHLLHTQTTSDEFPLPDFPETHIHRSQLTRPLFAADGTDAWSVFQQRQFSLCVNSDAVLSNTVEEFEKIGLDMLRQLFETPVWPIGPLLRLSASYSTDTSCVEWLDSHPTKSVLYVSFGSQNTITASQMMELAMGLEASGRPFIWVIRPPVGFDIRGEFRPEWLPEGFEERNKQGLLVHGWAAQVEILSHRATGAFLSHCGWNSVLESLTRDVPIIGWPLSADQFYNSKFLEEEIGVGVEVARGNMENSRVERERVERVIGMVMGEKERGREMRRKAREIGEVLRAALREEEGGGGVVGSSVRGLNEFFQATLSSRGAL